jgi:hypothetical protein
VGAAQRISRAFTALGYFLIAIASLREVGVKEGTLHSSDCLFMYLRVRPRGRQQLDPLQSRRPCRPFDLGLSAFKKLRQAIKSLAHAHDLKAVAVVTHDFETAPLKDRRAFAGVVI